ncbi:MAG: site-specific DNA-methyltransferase [candidate division WS1 bacterium]|jgi:DNA modification methylase|nr:site-specific DNA-methyltransferase [candidate division WS1 bacterium]
MSNSRRRRENRLNALSPRDWLKFQKSWFVHNPPPREKGVLTHPAKFPESLCQEFIEFFTKPGQLVLDPMAGTGSALIAAVRAGRRGVGIDLVPKYVEIARERLQAETETHRNLFEDPHGAVRMICGDARQTHKLVTEPVDYVLTSPPYWDMLRRRGFETQRRRRADQALDVWYSEDPNDVGNVEEYETFLEELVAIYRVVAEVMRPQAYATIIVKNVKKGGRMFPLAWDLGRRVGEFLRLRDEKIWCQDNQRLAPYGMGYAWVSNTMHHYCLNFRKECSAC